GPARAAAPNAAPRTPQVCPGTVARPGHTRRRAPARGDPARVAARRPEVPRRGGAAVLGDDRGAPDALRRASDLRAEVHGERLVEGRAGDVPLDLCSAEPEPPPAPDRALRPRLDARRPRRLRRPRHARDTGAAVGQGPCRRGAAPAPRDRVRETRRTRPDPGALDVAARARRPQVPRPQGVAGVPGREAAAGRPRELAR